MTGFAGFLFSYGKSYGTIMEGWGDLMLETDLYASVKTMFEQLGYIVRGEVGGIDCLAVKDSVMIAIELKTSVSLKLIYQAVERQKVCESVYIAVPKDALKAHGKSKKQLIALLRRLEIGLIEVSGQGAVVVFDAVPYDMKRVKSSAKRIRTRIKGEFLNRKNDVNIGGSRGKIMTRYKEKLVLIASLIEENKTSTIAEIKKMTGFHDVSNIFRKNYYKWFERVKRGTYALTGKGIEEYKSLRTLLEGNEKTIQKD